MQTIFNPYLKETIFFRPEQMYGENRRVFKELPHIEDGNVYFIAERKRVRTIPESVQISDDGYISVSFLLGNGQKIPAKFPLASTIIDLGVMFKKLYLDDLNLQKYVKGVKDKVEYLSIQKKTHDLPFIGVSLDKDSQSKKNIALRIHTPDGQTGNLTLSIHSILSLFNIDIGDYPHVIYIGKSEHLQDRIYRHERIQEALAVIEDESDLYLYAFQFDAQKITIPKFYEPRSSVRKTDVHDVSKSDQLALVEMGLINYFKPHLNEKFKHAEIPANPVFNDALSTKYDQMVIEVDYESGFWNFGSDHIQSSLRHQIEYLVG